MFVNRSDAFTLDPQRMSYIQDFRLAHALYEGLVRWDNADFSILPAAAEMPEVSPDGLTYTFSIKPEARWSNGDPVTAHDFIYSWRRAILPDTAADYSNMFFLVEGAEDFFHWRSEQTTGFIADPFNELQREGSIGDKTVRRTIRRLESLLSAADLPAEVAPPRRGPPTPAAIRAQPVGRSGCPGAGGRGRTVAQTRVAGRDCAEPERAGFKSGRGPVDVAAGPRAALTRRSDCGPWTVWFFRCNWPGRARFFSILSASACFAPSIARPSKGWAVDSETIQKIHAGGWHAVTPPPADRRRWLQINPRTGRLEQKHHWTKPGVHVGNGTLRPGPMALQARHAPSEEPTLSRCGEGSL